MKRNHTCRENLIEKIDYLIRVAYMIFCRKRNDLKDVDLEGVRDVLNKIIDFVLEEEKIVRNATEMPFLWKMKFKISETKEKKKSRISRTEPSYVNIIWLTAPLVFSSHTLTWCFSYTRNFYVFRFLYSIVYHTTNIMKKITS